jgi:hypothetical protein
MSMRHTILIATLMVAALAANGQAPAGQGGDPAGAIWGPPVIESPMVRFEPTVAKEMVKGLNLAGWPIALEQTELIAAQEHFGGTIGNRGDAGNALAWLCLFRHDTGGSWVLWLESSEADGATIGSFRWQQLDDDSALEDRCQQVKGGNVSFTPPRALRLGMKEADVVKELGQPSMSKGDTAVYEHVHSLTIHSVPYSASNIVTITYRDGRVWAVAVTHSTVS